MFGDLDDPKQQALLAAAFGLLGSQGGKGFGGFAKDAGNAGLLGMKAYTLASENKRRSVEEAQQAKMRDFQMRQLEQDQQWQQALQSGFKPGAPATPAMVSDDFPGAPYPAQPAQAPGFDFSAAMKLNPLKTMQVQQSMKPAGPQYKVVGNRLVKIDGDGVSEAYAPPEAQEKPPELIRYQKLADDPTQPESVRRVAAEYVKKATTHAPAANVTTNVMPPREVFKDSLGLKKDFDGQPEVKGFKEVQGAWDQISTALKNPSPANDLAAATKFMKLLDPGSVVRESELIMAMQASGALDRFMNTADRVLKGQKLTPQQRVDFYKSGEALFNASKERYGQTVQQYEGIADQYNLDKRFIQNAKPRDTSPVAAAAPKPGTVDGDYYFKGGDPADPKNWVKRK